MRILFTGGSGKAGRHVAPFLAEQGHQVTNADLVPLGHPDVNDLHVDLTDAGQVYSALAGGRAWVIALAAAAIAMWMVDLARRALVRRRI